MAKEIKYNGKLLNPVTNEEMPCIIIGSVRYIGGKYDYLRLRKLPASPLLDSMFPNPYEENGMYYEPPRLAKKYNHFPFILVDDATNSKMAVQLVSCSYKGVKHYNVTVREVINGLNYAESVEQFATMLVDK